ncbi:serine hydrolase domain-containing protein [Streptomyces sp. NPDC090022]|uniref:serine hydrolase domain-containing protein n=1 Tax=Streptomyces sp. NPDC090022 TaxID=3365920 RepID=UPI003810ACFE
MHPTHPDRLDHTASSGRPARRQRTPHAGRRVRQAAAAATVALALLTAAAPAASAATAPAADSATSGTFTAGLERKALDASLRAVHDAGIYGVYAAARDGGARWNGAAGFADVVTQRPTRPDLRHRVGSVTKSFTAVAVLQQSAKGRIGLDRPIGDYLPELVPGERGRKITVRMVMNHTSGIADYIGEAFPSLKAGSTSSLDDERHRTITPTELVNLGVALPQSFEPGTDWAYSNTNYILLGELLRKVTGQDPEQVITRDVIRRAGLRDTYFPGAAAKIKGPHAKMYDNWFGLIDPPRDYSEYNMTWAGTAGALISTTQDLNSFYRQLLGGGLLPAAQLREMRTTWPVKAPDGTVVMNYGLGILSVDTSCGPAWGHNGAVFGAGTESYASADGRRQVSIGYNLMKYQRFDDQGKLIPHPGDAALQKLTDQALCGTAAPAPAPAPAPEKPKVPLTAPQIAPELIDGLRR